MLLALLFVIILSSQTGITILVKSIIVLILGPPNLDSFFSINETDFNDTQMLNSLNETTCDFENAPGTYKFESSSNFDNYLKALGVGFIMRQLASLAQPVVTLSVDCNQDTNADAIIIEVTNTNTCQHDEKYEIFKKIICSLMPAIVAGQSLQMQEYQHTL